MTEEEKFVLLYERFLDELDKQKRTWTGNEALGHMSVRVRKMEDELERDGIDTEQLKKVVLFRKSN